MAVLTNTMMQGTSADTGDGDEYQIPNSIKLYDDSDPEVKRFQKGGDTRKWTWSAWIKRTEINTSVHGYVFASYNDTNNHTRLQWATQDKKLQLYDKTGGNVKADYKTNAVHMDPTAWYHVVVVADTNNAVTTERFKIYINGEIQTLTATTAYPQHQATWVNKVDEYMQIGSTIHDAALKGLISDVQVIDGLALSPAAFGSFDSSGCWNPKAFALPAPNDGRTWSSSVTTNDSAGFTSGNGVANMFDDSEADGYPVNADKTITMTFNPAIEVKQGIRLQLRNGGRTHASWGSTITGTGIKQTHIKNDDCYELWPVDVDYGTKLANLTITPDSGDWAQCAKLEIDGVVLVDGKTDVATRTNPNTGTVWSSGTTSGVASGIGNGFDGNTSTYISDTGGANAAWTLTFPSSIPDVTLVEVWPGSGQPDGTKYTCVIGGVTQTYTISGSYREWVPVYNGSAGTLTGVGGQRNSNNQGGSYRAVRVNGHVLIDSARDNSCHLKFADTSTNAALGKDSLQGKIEDATGGLPIYNTTSTGDDYGEVKGSGYRTDSSAGTTASTGLLLAVPGDSVASGTCDVHQAINTGESNKAATVTGAVVSTTESRLYGSSLYFDGSDDIIKFPGTALGTDPFTIECWVKLPSSDYGTGGYSQIVGNIASSAAGYWRMGSLFNGSPNFWFAFSSGSYNDIMSGKNIHDDVWHHICVVREGTGSDQLKMYIDGILVKKHDCAQDLSQTEDWRLMASDQSGGFCRSKGFIQDVRVYKNVAKYTKNFNPPTRNDVSLKNVDRTTDLDARQGYAGGDAYAYGGGNSGGGGGGGAGEEGAKGVSGTTAGDGGDGIQSSITGTATWYAGGGGGGSWGTAAGDGGQGGGGDGKLGGSSTGAANPGTANTGGGGGGAGYSSADWQDGGDGGSGIIVVRYDNTKDTASVSGTNTAITPSGYKGWKFTAGSGSITMPGSNAPSTLEYLIVAGGGGAETGGGGAGGVLQGSMSVTAGQAISWTVGAGGAGAPGYPNAATASNGANSVLGTLTAIGGGGGGGGDSGTGATDGGSGGGGGTHSAPYIKGGKGVGQTSDEQDIFVDSPTDYAPVGGDTGVGGEVRGNYCVLNDAGRHQGLEKFEEGSLTGYEAADVFKSAFGTLGMPSGKWYFECNLISIGETSDPNCAGVGVITSRATNRWNTYFNKDARGYAYMAKNGETSNNDAIHNTGYTAWNNTSDTVGVAFDADAGKIYFAHNNTWQGSSNPVTGANAAYTGLTDGPYLPALELALRAKAVMNFGQKPFKYTAPSGYKCLCTTNLSNTFSGAELNNPSKYFDVKTYTGNGGTQTITGLEFQPDLVWLKKRSASGNHTLWDAARGVTKRLMADTADIEATRTAGLTAFNSDGFTTGNDGTNNDSNQTYVAWNWDCGTAAATASTDGTITPSAQWVNATAGFSISTYTGTGSAATIGHGLGAKPEFIIVKSRESQSSNASWTVHHTLVPIANTLVLDTDAAAGASGSWNSTAPTNTVFSIGTVEVVNTSGKDYVAYCWTPIDGYSMFTSYIGNASAEGPYIHCGFRPRLVIVKNMDAGGPSNSGRNWVMRDTARDDDNPVKNYSLADSDNGGFTYEGSTQERFIDVLANGFKVRSAVGGGDAQYTPNVDGDTYAVAAFAEYPSKTARAR